MPKPVNSSSSPLFNGESGCANIGEHRARGIHKYRVYYEDTDAGGIVYYAKYLQFFERARTDFLRSKNIIQSHLAKDLGIVFVVRNCAVEYIKPARMDDLLEVFVEITEVGLASIRMQQEIKVNDIIICKMAVEIVCVDAVGFRPKKIPKNLQKLIVN